MIKRGTYGFNVTNDGNLTNSAQNVELLASCGDLPAFSKSSPRLPNETFTNDCVATAPTPASAHDTIDPTENQCD